MKLKNIKEVEEFRKVVNKCKQEVYIKSQNGDVYNLKSPLNEYVALSKLLGEHGDELELFANNKEDEMLLINFLYNLEK